MLKRYLDITYLFVLVLLLSIQIFGQDITGAGTVGDPYILYNAADVDSIRYLGNGTSNTDLKYYELNNNIDFTGFGTFVPLFVLSDTYISFDGNNHTISNLSIGGAGTGTRWIAFIAQAGYNMVLKDVTFDTCSLTYSGACNVSYTGIIGNGTLAAGVFTVTNVKIKNSYIGVTVTPTNAGYQQYSGFLMGAGYRVYAYRNSVETSFNNFAANFNSSLIYAGSMFGQVSGIDSSTVKECFTTNNVVKVTHGGLASQGMFLGGFAGATVGWGTGITNCYSYNDSLNFNRNNTNTRIGGFIGSFQSGTPSNNGTITCYSSPKIMTGNTTAYIGTFAGSYEDTDVNIGNWKSHTDTSKYPYISIESGESDTTRAPKKHNAADMKTQSTFTYFNFSTVWGIASSRQDGYPYLLWNPPAAAFALNAPQAGDVYDPGDTVFVEWGGAEDTVLFYYSLDGGDNFTFRDTAINYTYTWNAVDELIAGSTIWVLITSLDGTLRDSCHSFTINPIKTITEPNGGEVYFENGIIPITYEFSLDSIKIYYSTDAGSSWIFLVQDTSSGLYNWTAPALNNINMRVMITDVDSNYQVESLNSFSIFLSNKFLEIIDPTEISQTIVSDQLRISVRSVNADYFIASFSRNGSGYEIINDSVVVDPGDGIAPDTTIFYWDISNEPLLGTYTIKVNVLEDSTFTGSSTDPYYGVGDYEYTGKRGAHYSAQSVNQWSELYELDDELYTISFYGYVWGWYDFSDRIDLWKWNSTTDSFQIISTLATPGAAYYPYISIFRSTPYTFTMWNKQTGSSGYYRSTYKTSTITYPGTIGEWSDNVYGSIPTNIDNGNTVVNYNGWQYTLDQTERTITALDLYNPGNEILVTDASAGGIVGVGNSDFYVFDDHIIISRKYYESEFGDAKVWIVGNAFPQNTPGASDTVSFVLQGQMRNYFRGIYPNAIIEYYPPIR